jgi:signal transduction histidine kinase
MPTQPEIPTELDLIEFISKEAHDLKSPFNRSLGFLRLVIKGMDGPITDQAREDLTIAYQNSQEALALVSGLIETARLVRAERSIHPASSELEALLSGAVKEWTKLFPQEKPAAVRWDAPPAVLQVDEILFRRMLVNWFAYVQAYTPQDAQVSVQVVEAAPGWTFSIRSTGVKGPPPPESKLALSGFIARRLLELHQGVLDSVEEREDGAEVRFSL